MNGIRPQLNLAFVAREIRINGQEEAATMVLIDGLPIVSGLSTVWLFRVPQALIEELRSSRAWLLTLRIKQLQGLLI